MPRSRIKWFSPQLFYGFIKDGLKPGIDLFFHGSDVRGDVTLDSFDLVEYEIVEHDKGFMGVNVKKIKQKGE
jgi:cold shock CspA family protein